MSVTYTTVPNPYYSTVRMPARVGSVAGGGTWRGAHRGMQNYNYNNSTSNSSNHNIMNNNRGYYRGNRGRVGHPRYNYDNNMQQFQVKPLVVILDYLKFQYTFFINDTPVNLLISVLILLQHMHIIFTYL